MRSARIQARLHLLAVVLFLVQIPVALLTSIRDSVPYLVFLSLWALVAGHLGAYQAARSEEASLQSDRPPPH